MNPTTPTTTITTPAAPVQPAQATPQEQPQQSTNAITATEAVFALACYTYYFASKMSFTAIDNLDPALVVVNTLANPEILDAYNEVKAAEDREKALEDRTEPVDTMLGGDADNSTPETIATA